MNASIQNRKFEVKCVECIWSCLEIILVNAVYNNNLFYLILDQHTYSTYSQFIETSWFMMDEGNIDLYSWKLYIFSSIWNSIFWSMKLFYFSLSL
jgi:hypothetical protein